MPSPAQPAASPAPPGSNPSFPPPLTVFPKRIRGNLSSRVQLWLHPLCGPLGRLASRIDSMGPPFRRITAGPRIAVFAISQGPGPTHEQENWVHGTSHSLSGVMDLVTFLFMQFGIRTIADTRKLHM